VTQLEHLSYSSISSYLLCGHAWRLRYVDRVEVPTAPALVFGTAWHTMTEEYLRTGAPLGELWTVAWQATLEREPNVDWSQESPESAAATGMRMLNSQAVRDLLSAIRDNFDPETCHMERRVELRVPGVPVPIIGYVDIITKDGVPGDFKTAARMWSDNKPLSESQPLVYLAALNQVGENAHGWRFRYYVFTKAAKPTARMFETQYSASDVLTTLFPTIHSVWQAIQAEAFPKVMTSWKCSPKWCEYWGMCRGNGG
jgi:hypothetical protein